MAATGFTPIILYHSATGSLAPTDTNLAAGELALNTLDEKLYFKNSSNVVKVLANSAIAGIVPGTGVATALAVNVGTAGAFVVNGGALGTPSSGTATNITGLPPAGVTGTALVAAAIGTTVQAYDADLTTWAGITPGANVGTALAVNVGTAGAFVVNGGVLGTPSSGTVTNLTGTASININGTVGATTPAAGSFTTVTVDVNSTGGYFGDYKRQGVQIGYFYFDATTLQLSCKSSRDFVFLQNDVERMRLTSGGINGVIGATTPAAGSFTTLSASGVSKLGTGSYQTWFKTAPATLGAGQFFPYDAGTDQRAMAISSFYSPAGLRVSYSTGSQAYGGDPTALTFADCAVFSSTGLAVTGALSASGAIKSNFGNLVGFPFSDANQQLVNYITKAATGNSPLVFGAVYGPSPGAVIFDWKDSSGSIMTLAQSGGLAVTGTLSASTSISTGLYTAPSTNVGIARQSATDALEIKGTGTYIARFNNDTSTSLGGNLAVTGTLSATGSNATIIVCRRDTSTNAYSLYSAAGELNFYNGSANTLTLSSAGVLDLPIGQIKFPATQNASSDPNTLDDYEEGTWTPVFEPQTSGSITTDTSYGYYTKKGREVTCIGSIAVASVSSPVGNLYINAFPFTSMATARTAGSAIFQVANATAGTQSSIRMWESSTSAAVFTRYAVGTATSDASDIKAGTIVYFSVTYFV